MTRKNNYLPIVSNHSINTGIRRIIEQQVMKCDDCMLLMDRIPDVNGEDYWICASCKTHKLEESLET